jgi:hypothetical protein
VTVGSDRDKRVALQPPFIVDRIPLSHRTTSPQTIAAHCLNFGGYLETILTTAILMVPSVRFEALLPLVDATPVRVHSLVASCYDVLAINPSGWQWLADDRRSHAIELVQSAFGNKAVSVRVRGKVFMGEWAKMPYRANENLGTNKVSRSRSMILK